MDDAPAIADVTSALEAWAPPGSAQDYDNVGLQVGNADRSVSAAVLALDAQCHGDRIAQMVVAPVARATFHLMEDLGTSSRGDGGFGSTGAV